MVLVHRGVDVELGPQRASTWEAASRLRSSSCRAITTSGCCLARSLADLSRGASQCCVPVAAGGASWPGLCAMLSSDSAAIRDLQAGVNDT